MNTVAGRRLLASVTAVGLVAGGWALIGGSNPPRHGSASGQLPIPTGSEAELSATPLNGQEEQDLRAEKPEMARPREPSPRDLSSGVEEDSSDDYHSIARRALLTLDDLDPDRYHDHADVLSQGNSLAICSTFSTERPNARFLTALGTKSGATALHLVEHDDPKSIDQWLESLAHAAASCSSWIDTSSDASRPTEYRVGASRLSKPPGAGVAFVLHGVNEAYEFDVSFVAWRRNSFLDVIVSVAHELDAIPQDIVQLADDKLVRILLEEELSTN